MSNSRIIHTGLFTSSAEQILRNFFKYKKDNTEHRMYRNAERVKVKCAPDGEILLEAFFANSWDNEEGRRYYGQSIWDKNKDNDAKPKEWLAIAIKHHVIEANKSDGAWRRNNDSCLIKDFATKDKSGSFTFIPMVSDLYCVYDHLLGRKALDKKYGQDLVKKIIGTRRDPLLTEMKINRRNKVKQIEEEYAAAEKAAKDKRDRLNREYYAKLQAQADAEILVAKEQKEKALKEVEEIVKMVLEMNKN